MIQETVGYDVPKKGTIIVGVDEVGRGPLAGPVVACAVILNTKKKIHGLADSKKLTQAKRQALAELIKERALAWCLGRSEVWEIDSLNILQASLLAMKRAVLGLSIKPDLALVDGNKLPELNCPGQAIIKGDEKIEQISAASIIAKVARDAEMLQWHEQYPEYGFAQHKGYPTAFHLQALQKNGVTAIHRRTFAPVKKLIES